VPAAFAWENDATSTTDRVIDGDTFDTTTEGRIRLADVDAPEHGESGYYYAKNMLDEYVNGQTVYLDIDDVHRTGPYGRLICVVYVNHNSTHLMNVNEALLLEGAVVIDNYNNEFNPYSWTLYVQRMQDPQNSSVDHDNSWRTEAIIGFLISVGILAAIVYIVIMSKK
jgi:endonuclease YncB( thermonuclease family)